MPNITSGFWSKFGKQPGAGGNNANRNLERNVGIYVQSYLKNRNTPNKVPPLNNLMANALHKYINAKRARVAAAAAAAAGNAGAPAQRQANIAAGTMSTPPSAPPSVAGNNAANAAKRAGATAIQQAAAAASAAQQQALVLHKPPAAAQQAGAEAAANAAQQARPNASAAQQAQTAAAGAEAANVNAKRAALEALLSGVTNNNITSPNGKSIAEVEKLKANLEALKINNNRKTAVLRLINNRLRANAANIGVGGSGGANLNSLRGAVNQNTNVMNKAQATSELRRLNILLKKVGQVNNANLKTKINNYRRRLNAKVSPAAPTRAESLMTQTTRQQSPRQTNPNLEKTIKAPNGRNIVVIRAQKNARWNFKNEENKTKYNLNNRNKNTPVIRNVNLNASSMFKQGN